MRSPHRAPKEKEQVEVEKEVARVKSGRESKSINNNNKCLAFRRDSEEASLPELKRVAS